jgi:RNA polymerase sigma-70 factor (ECF subfamily)
VTSPKRLSQEHQRSLERRLKAGDERALAELFDLVAPWILGLALHILHDEDEAEDVVGDVFVQVWRHIDQHDAGRGPIVPWILSIARNRSLDALRRRRRWWRKSAHLEQAQVMEVGGSAPAASHEAAVPGWPVHREVHAALAALSEEQRRVVVLSYFEGLSHREIAQRLHLPLGTVKTRLRMAHQTLTEGLRHLKDWVE